MVFHYPIDSCHIWKILLSSVRIKVLCYKWNFPRVMDFIVDLGKTCKNRWVLWSYEFLEHLPWGKPCQNFLTLICQSPYITSSFDIKNALRSWGPQYLTVPVDDRLGALWILPLNIQVSYQTAGDLYALAS